jgi:AcrR family transcriptional regulator
MTYSQFMQERLTPVDTGRRQRRKTETRRQIFQAAMKLFEKKGFFGTTVEEITDNADVGKGTFFNYFPSKEAILSALAERQLGIIAAAAEKARSAASVRPVLKEMCKELTGGPGRSQLLLRSVFAVLLSNQELYELFSNALQQGRERVAAIITRGQQLGEIRSDMPALELARCLQQAAFGTSFIWAVSPSSDLMLWQGRSMDLFWRGIAARPEPIALQRNGHRKGGGA